MNDNIISYCIEVWNLNKIRINIMDSKDPTKTNTIVGFIGIAIGISSLIVTIPTLGFIWGSVFAVSIIF